MWLLVTEIGLVEAVNAALCAEFDGAISRIVGHLMIWSGG